MIVQKFYIDKYDWQVVVLYEVGYRNKDYVIDMLKEICNKESIINQAKANLNLDKYNTGFTYSDLDERCSLMVIGKASSNRETVNTIVHEANHLKSHIATKYNIDEKGEEVCYLIGGIVRTMFRVFSKIICS
jgi:hypothetical protein